MVGAADVLHKGVEHRPAIVASLHQVAKELPHQGHIGDMLQEDGHVSEGKHHSTLRFLQ